MLIRILSVIAYILLAPFVGALIDGADRVISARMQGRQGPKLLQPFYDLRKLLNKQLLTVNRVQGLLVFSFVVFVIFSGCIFFAGMDLLMCFFALTTAAMFLVLAASCTSSPFSSMSAQRELMQMMAYEPMVLLTAVGFYMATGTFQVSGILQSHVSAILKLWGILIGFLFILTIKMRKSPCDVSTSHHAHQEMVKGVTLEMVGPLFAAINLAEWYENVLLLGVVLLFFVNAAWWSWIIAVVLVAVCWFVEVLIDNTSARLRWDKVLVLAWIVTLLAAGLNLLILMLI